MINKDSIMKIQVKHKNYLYSFEIVSDLKIKKYLSDFFNLNEKEFILLINNKICGIDDSLGQYIIDNNSLDIEIFNVNQLLMDYKEYQSLKNSQNFTQEGPQNPIIQEIQYENIDRNVKEDDNKYFSEIISQKVTCQYCMQEILENIISTPCQHFYHSECLDQHISNSLQHSGTIFKCLCKYKIPQHTLRMLGEEKYKNYKELLLKNQLFYIQKQYLNKIGRCIDNPQCQFWFFLQTNNQIRKKIACFECPSHQISERQPKSLIQNQSINIQPEPIKTPYSVIYKQKIGQQNLHCLKDDRIPNNECNIIKNDQKNGIQNIEDNGIQNIEDNGIQNIEDNRIQNNGTQKNKSKFIQIKADDRNQKNENNGTQNIEAVNGFSQIILEVIGPKQSNLDKDNSQFQKNDPKPQTSKN